MYKGSINLQVWTKLTKTMQVLQEPALQLHLSSFQDTQWEGNSISLSHSTSSRLGQLEKLKFGCQWDAESCWQQWPSAKILHKEVLVSFSSCMWTKAHVKLFIYLFITPLSQSICHSFILHVELSHLRKGRCVSLSHSTYLRNSLLLAVAMH